MPLYFFTAVICPNLPVPENGFIVFAVDTSAPYDYLTMATYQCNEGYGLSASGDSVRTCILASSGGGGWSGEAPICEGMYIKEKCFINRFHFKFVCLFKHQLSLASH